MIAQLGQGMLTSVLIYALTLIGAVPLALPLALARGGKSKIARLLTGAYISFMRGTPLMLQLIAVYFGPWYLFRIRISDGYRFYAVIIAFVLNYAAYFAEIYRAGIAAVPKGQREAAGVFPHSAAAGDKAYTSAYGKRVYNAYKGYFAGVCYRRDGNVHPCQANIQRAAQHGAADSRGGVLLCV